MKVALEHLSIEKEGELAHVVLERPERLNAIHQPAARDLDAAARLLDQDEDVKLVTIRGAGRSFCSGIDLKEIAKEELGMNIVEPWESAMRQFETMDKIVMSVVDGHAIGGGLQLGIASDIRVSTPDAQWGLTAIEESILPGLGTWRLARFVGLGRAKKLTLLGNIIDGEEARRIGLVDHLVEAETIEEEVEALIERYMRANSIGARLSKQAVNDSFDLDFEAFYDRYLELQEEAMASPDFAEAKAALREDRDPNWN